MTFKAHKIRKFKLSLNALNVEVKQLTVPQAPKL